MYILILTHLNCMKLCVLYWYTLTIKSWCSLLLIFLNNMQSFVDDILQKTLEILMLILFYKFIIFKKKLHVLCCPLKMLILYFCLPNFLLSLERFPKIFFHINLYKLGTQKKESAQSIILFRSQSLTKISISPLLSLYYVYGINDEKFLITLWLRTLRSVV